MDEKKAREILGVSENATPDEIKKAYRKLAVEHHPDRGGDATKFKEVGEAHMFLTTGKSFGPTEQSFSSQSGTINLEEILRRSGFGDPFGHSGGFSPFTQRVKRPSYQVEDKNLSVTISFREAVLGCQRELSYSRSIKCADCNGLGHKLSNNGCATCNGRGTIIKIMGNMHVQQACPSCHGSQKTNPCINCNQKGVQSTNTTITVNVPAGVTDEKNVLALRGMGDFVGTSFNNDVYADIPLRVSVINDVFLKIKNNDVLCNKTISLLEALQGTTITVPTIDGVQDVVVPQLIHHNDEIVIPNMGVDRAGNQKVIISIRYPAVTKQLINALKKSEEN